MTTASLMAMNLQSKTDKCSFVSTRLDLCNIKLKVADNKEVCSQIM
jgi:hypothetical protein